MNGEGQRPPAPPETAQASSDAPEPGNARYPQQAPPNGNGNGQYADGQQQPPQAMDGMPPPQQQQQQQRPQGQQQQGQRQQHQHQHHQQRQQQRPPEPQVPVEGVLDVDHRGNGRLRTAKYNYLPQP